MPIYEYFCDKCKESFELTLSIKVNSKEVECPKCKTRCKKTISLSAFHLKGNWFKQGY